MKSWTFRHTVMTRGNFARRIQLARRLLEPDSVWTVSRIPHFRGQLGTSSSQLSGRLFLCMPLGASALESNKAYCNLNPKCEPQLGKRGLLSGPRRSSGRGTQRTFHVVGFEFV